MEKNIKDYLPFYVGQLAEISNLSQRMITYGFEDGQVRINGYLIDTLEKENAFTIKPILRKLSSMTEEEAISTVRQDWRVKDAPLKVLELSDVGFRYRVGRITIDRFVYLESLNPEQTRYLLSKGFDLFGLIDAGLAIEKQSNGFRIGN